MLCIVSHPAGTEAGPSTVDVIDGEPNHGLCRAGLRPGPCGSPKQAYVDHEGLITHVIIQLRALRAFVVYAISSWNVQRT